MKQCYNDFEAEQSWGLGSYCAVAAKPSTIQALDPECFLNMEPQGNDVCRRKADCSTIMCF